MQRWIARLETIGHVTAFDYGYMREGRRRCDPLPKLIACHREALMQARQTQRGPVFLIGKSLGSRVGCHLALEEKVEGGICLGYPLCGGGDRMKLRAEVLLTLTTPILFVQGTRDPLSPLDVLESVRRKMRATNAVYVVEGGDHSLLVTKSRLKSDGETQNEVDDRILGAIRNFVIAGLQP
jgi:uncharacterized protein